MENNKYLLLEKVMRMFGIYFLILGVGLFVGQFVPSAFTLPLMIAVIVLLIVTSFVKFKRRGGALFYTFISFVLGICLYSSMAYYVGELGISIVVSVVGVASILFGILGTVGFKIKRDLSGWSTYLFVGLIALVLFSIFAMFLPFSSTLALILSGVGILIFSLYTVYEMNLIANGHITHEEVPNIAFGLFLNYINIVLDLLRIVSLSRD